MYALLHFGFYVCLYLQPVLPSDQLWGFDVMDNSEFRLDKDGILFPEGSSFRK